MLVIVGAGGLCDKCVPYMEISDCCDRCRNGGICYSDYLMTDIDDDGIPNGPITRLPVISKAQADELVELASRYSSGDHGASFGQVMTICDDEVIADDIRYSNGEYARSIADVVDMYDALGYAARRTLRTSILSGDGEDWFDSAVAQANEGVMEMWGFGTRFNYDNWANIIRPYGPDYWLNWNEYTRDGMFVAWMPSCKTALSDTVLHDGQCRLQRSVYGAFALPEYMITATSCKARCAALVGHIDAGWDMQHIWMNEALVQSRSGAIPGTTYVAEVAYNAVRMFCDAHPDQKEYAASVGVLGGLTTVQGCEITSAGDAHGQERDVMTATSKGGQVTIDYVSPIEGDMAMGIYDLRGRLIVQKECGVVQNGRGQWTWDGRRENGGSVGSGMYLFRMRISGAGGEIIRATKGVIVR